MPNEYLGASIECPVCHNEFVCEESKICAHCGAVSPVSALKCAQCGSFFIRKNPSAKAPAVQVESAPGTVVSPRSVADTSSGEQSSFFSWKIILLLLLFAGGYYFIVMPWLEKHSQEEQKEQMRNEIINLFTSKDFIYYGAQVADIQPQQDSGIYMVTFRRNGKLYTRPVRRRQSTIDKGRYFTEMAFKYSEKPEYLVEDADLFWEKIKKDNPNLASYRLIEAKPLTPGIVRCTFSNGEETGKADLQITEREAYAGGTPQLKYEFTPVSDFL